jgi:hypothetical protein
MQARDTMDNNKRLRKMEDTEFERAGEKHGWDKAKHELAMERARRADARANRPRKPTLADDISRYGGYSIAPAVEDVGGGVDNGAGNGAPAPLPSFPQGGVSAGEALRTQPLQMSIQAIPASAHSPAGRAGYASIAGAVIEYDLIPGQGLVLRGQNLSNRGFA